MTETLKSERKSYLKDLRRVSTEAATTAYGTPSKYQLKKTILAIQRTYNMLHRLQELQYIKRSSFRYGYGGRTVIINFLIEKGIVEKLPRVGKSRRHFYILIVDSEMFTLDFVSSIFIEIFWLKYQKKFDLEDLED